MQLNRIYMVFACLVLIFFVMGSGTLGDRFGLGRLGTSTVCAAAMDVPESNKDAKETLRPLAEERKFLTTIRPAVIYTFGGLSNEKGVEDILSRLVSMQARGTFFIMENEMKRYPETVRKIIASGQDIGLAIRPKDGSGYEVTYNEIVSARRFLQDQFGVTTDLVKQPWGTVSDDTRAAVAAAGCQLIGQTVNAVQSKDKDAKSADEVMAHIFGPAVTALGRGQIVHFRMDYYTDPLLAGQVMAAVKQRKIDNIAYRAYDDDPADSPANDSAYRIESIHMVLADKQAAYAYPVQPENVPAALRSDYNPIKEEAGRNFLDTAVKRYIGAPTVDMDDRMIGFSNKEMRRLDETGLIHTKDPVVFFTFDDWGMDDSVNKLLYVLRKHKGAGTFFVLTHNVQNNPNLLRAIGAGGNEIACHSEWHKPMAVRDPKTGKEHGVQTAAEYKEDLATAYRKLESIVGDQQLDGRYALTRFFRAPTLAVSKMGFESLFETGYDFIVSGSYSTEDYQARNVHEMVQKLNHAIYSRQGINRGAVIVMHMTSSAKQTARALDIILTANELRPEGDPLKFRIGRLSEYLTEGYSQADRKTMNNYMKDEEHK